ncbi:MAG: hypothetical protein WC559_00840 [Candidatus Omnitrophota bacterium]
MDKYLRKMPQELRGLIALARETAEEEGVSAYLVGGFVRDLIMGFRNLDSDIAIEGDGIKFSEALAAKTSARLVRHHRFATATVVFGPHLKFDVSTARRESYPFPAALPVIEAGAIGEDLGRRDFTINAMAVSINRRTFGELMDIYGGRRDIAARNIRVLHDLSFIDDPTRMLRAVRFSRRYNFRIEPRTMRLFKEAARLRMLERVHPHRVRDELVLILKEDEPLKPLKAIQELTGLGFIDKKLKFSKSTESLMWALKRQIRWFRNAHPRRRHLDTWVIYFSALLESLGAAGARRVARKFALSKGEAKRILTANDFKPDFLRRLSSADTKPSRIYRMLEPLSYEAIIMLRAKYPKRGLLKHIDNFFAVYNGMRISVSGHDLRKLGVAPGPRYQKIFRRILDARLNGTVRTKEEENALAKRLAGH